MKAPKFRQDINGLRALAVIGVIAFHFKLGPLRAGGFAGVDVFFVISGFLMTQIITGRLDRGRFAFAAFFQARVRRILPAFVAMVIGVMLAGLLVLSPLAYEALAERSAWTLPFLSNVLFARQGTYFVAPEQNWLLHTWSLSVEAQFYLLFPVLLVLLRRAGLPRSVEAICVGLAAIVSFAITVWSASAGGDAMNWSFYMLWSRAWEFLVGALCVYALPLLPAREWARAGVHYAGLGAIVLSMLIFHNTTPWPSLATMLPVAGTAAVVIAAHDRPRWASAAPTREIGAWSYSVYLWHWPMAAALASFDHWSVLLRIAGACLSVLIGAASYRWIEVELTDRLSHGRWRPWIVGGAVFASAFTIAITASVTGGFALLRLGPTAMARLRDFRDAQSDWGTPCEGTVVHSAFLTECRFGAPNVDNTLVIGDSIAGQLAPRYRGALSSQFGISFAYHVGCKPFAKTTRVAFPFACERYVDEALAFALDSDFKRIVFVAAWPDTTTSRLCLLSEANCGLDLPAAIYEERLVTAYHQLAVFWKRLRDSGKAVIVFNTVPYPGDDGDPVALYRRVFNGEPLEKLDMPYSRFELIQLFANRQLRLAADYAGATLVNPATSVCPNGDCPIVAGGRALYSNDTHVRASMMKETRFSIFDTYIAPGQSLSFNQPSDTNSGNR